MGSNAVGTLGDHNLRKGPAPKKRIAHLGAKVREDGAVSALCFKSPRAIDMVRSTWVMRKEAVTCSKCRAIIDVG